MIRSQLLGVGAERHNRSGWMITPAGTRPGPQILGQNTPLPIRPGCGGVKRGTFLQIRVALFVRQVVQPVNQHPFPFLPAYVDHERACGCQDIKQRMKNDIRSSDNPADGFNGGMHHDNLTWEDAELSQIGYKPAFGDQWRFNASHCFGSPIADVSAAPNGRTQRPPITGSTHTRIAQTLKNCRIFAR